MDTATQTEIPLPAMTLDQACRLMSCWRTAAEMHADLGKPGNTYMPTLRDDDNAAPGANHKQAIALMRAECVRMGWGYYDGSELHDPARLERGLCSVAWCKRGAHHEGGHDYKRRRESTLEPVCSVGGCWEKREPGSEYCKLGPAHRGSAEDLDVDALMQAREVTDRVEYGKA